MVVKKKASDFFANEARDYSDTLFSKKGYESFVFHCAPPGVMKKYTTQERINKITTKLQNRLKKADSIAQIFRSRAEALPARFFVASLKHDNPTFKVFLTHLNTKKPLKERVRKERKPRTGKKGGRKKKVEQAPIDLEPRENDNALADILDN